jgi:PEP-CTERM motif
MGGGNGDPFTLYVTDGIDGETHGLFAAIVATPEPSSLVLLAGAFVLFGVSRANFRR